jgi:L-fuconolactonase
MPYSIIDAHQHFWKFDPLRDDWITEDMKLLKRDFLPGELEPVLEKNQISGTVVVQSDTSELENEFQLGLAEKYSFIKGIVGWVDLESADLEERLSRLQRFSKLKGFRHPLQGEKQRDKMLQPTFQRGIRLLNKFGFSYDLLILPDQLEYAEKLVAAHPDQRFVIDHLAKPPIKQGIILKWKKAMLGFARYQNVFCKISGMVTEADWQNWKREDFHPYISTVVEIFGPKRIMFGSDWPVCLTAGNYGQVKQIMNEYFSSFTITEQADFFGANAMSFYQII